MTTLSIWDNLRHLWTKDTLMKHGMPHHPGEHRHDNVKAHKEPQHGAHHLKEGVDHLHAHHAQIEIEVKREGDHKRRGHRED
jgi:hypothetical protein